MTGIPFRIFNLRARRRKPGMMPQHVLSAKALASITGGFLEGCAEGSRDLVYLPGRPRPGRYTFELGTAGSTTLVFQTILAPLAYSGRRSFAALKGGTHVQWSPPADFIENVFLPPLSDMGVKASFSTLSRGYYPGGGGVVDAAIDPAPAALAPFRALKRGRLLRLRITSAVSNLPMSIAERQMKSASAMLSAYEGAIAAELREAPSPGTGTSIFILAEFEHTRAGFGALGARGKRAEEVGIEAAAAFLEYMETDSAVDAHLADQLLIYMALARGESVFTAARLTGHLLTNIHTIEKFLPARFKVEGSAGGRGLVAAEGAPFAKPA